MSDPAEMLERLAAVARAQGLRRVMVSDPASGIHYRFDLPPIAAVPVATSLVIRPVSVPNTETDDAVRASKKRSVAAYLDAVEGAHINGYPNLADYGLVPGDV